MKVLVFGLAAMAAVLVLDGAFAQQGPIMPLPLTEWRAALDADLSKLSMPRDAHADIFNILQAHERRAQVAKMKEAVPPITHDPNDKQFQPAEPK